MVTRRRDGTARSRGAVLTLEEATAAKLDVGVNLVESSVGQARRMQFVRERATTKKVPLNLDDSGAVLTIGASLSPEQEEALLAAFQARGWPMRIPNPLPPPAGHQKRTEQLYNVVGNLNRRQINRLIHFHSEDKGKFVRWSLRAST